MTIRDVKTYLVEGIGDVQKSFLFCRVEAADGTIGWGEAYAVPRRERGIAEFIKGLGDMLMKLDDPTPQNFQQNVTSWYDGGHVSIDFSAATSAIDVALWDIQGKQTEKPLCELLGTVLTRTLPIYANMDPLSPDESIDQLIERCQTITQGGFSAVKIYPMEHNDRATECVQRVREAVGPGTDLLLDIWALDDPQDAIEAAHAFAPFDPFWFEEPIAGERVDEMADIRKQVELPIVTGERQVGIHHFRSVLEKQAADILNPEILGSGGIQNVLEIGQLADSYGVKVSPHCWDSTLIGTAAMIHAMAVMPNMIIGEYFPHYAAFCSEFGELLLEIDGGTVTVGHSPGLGVRMNESALASCEI